MTYLRYNSGEEAPSEMETLKVIFIAAVICCLSTSAQTKYGLSFNDSLLRLTDTMRLSYPQGNAIILCVLLDANNFIIGTSPAQWSITGNITLVDTAVITNRIFIDAGLAMTNQKGYLIAQVSATNAQWVSDRVFITIKGKNSEILKITPAVKKRLSMYEPFDCLGRIYTMGNTPLPNVVVMVDLTNKKYKLIMGLKK